VLPASSVRRRLLRGVVAVLILTALVLAGLNPGVQSAVLEGYRALFSHDPAVTHAWVQRFGAWGPLVLVLAFVVQAVIPVIPALVLVLVSLLAYGPVVGFFIVYVGTLLGAAAGYGLGSAVGGPLIRALAGQRNRDRAHAFASEQGVRGVILIRLMPVLSSDLMNLVAGATRMPFGRFMAATALGALPVALLITWLAYVTAGSPARLGLGLLALSVTVGLVALSRTLLQGRRRRRRTCVPGLLFWRRHENLTAHRAASRYGASQHEDEDFVNQGGRAMSGSFTALLHSVSTPTLTSGRRVRATLLVLVLGVAGAVPATLASFRAQFDRMDAEGHLLLKVGQTSLPIDLYGVTLKIGADGMLGLMLPSSSSLDVKVVQKGTASDVAKVVLMRGTTNIADELVRKGYATRP